MSRRFAFLRVSALLAILVSVGIALPILWAQAPSATKATPAPKSPSRSPVVFMSLQQMDELLGKEEVIGELGLVEDQVRDIKQRLGSALAEYNNTVQAMMMRRNELPSLQKRVSEIQQRAKTEVEQLLLPNQVLRFRQLALQYAYQHRALQIYSSDEFQRELSYSPELRDAIRGDLANAERELREAVERINAATRERIQSRLTEEQRGKAELLVGPPFKFEKETPDQVRARIRNSTRR